MPLVAHSKLPSFARLGKDGEEILELDRAENQDIRELHIGLLNMMPDAALEVTERQFMRLVGSCNRIVQFYIHPFSLPGIGRSEESEAYLDRHYERFDDLRSAGLDALIITGANLPGTSFEHAPFWPHLVEVMHFATAQVTSTLCACLATHAALSHFHGVERTPLSEKRWGVFPHRAAQVPHPLTRNVNTRFDVPHSRFNDISVAQMEDVGMRVLVQSQTAGAHLAVSPDLFRFVYFQGHPEYDRNSLLKEYKREVLRFVQGERSDYPPVPEGYLSTRGEELLWVFEGQAKAGMSPQDLESAFPETEALKQIDNTWGDSARSVFNNWLGAVYQLTHRDRDKPFMPGVDPDDPLGLKR